MAKDKIEIKEIAPEPTPVDEAVSARQARWNKHVENYMIKSPKKGAAKKARGEFNTIPDSFK